MVFKKVHYSNTVINTFKKFAEFANTVSTICYTCLPNDDLLQEPDHVKECTPIPNTIEADKITWKYTTKPCNKFFHLSNHEESHFVQWYDFACGHNANEIEENTSWHCLKSYNGNEEMGEVSGLSNMVPQRMFLRLKKDELTSIF